MHNVEEIPLSVPNIPTCLGGEPHNFMPLSEKRVYCTKCASNVLFTKAKKK